MKYLKERFNYTSLKMQYLEEQFPALGAGKRKDGFGDIVEQDVADEGEVDDSLSDLNALKEELTQTKAKLKVEQNIAIRATKKLEHVEKVASQRIVESMPGTNFEDDTNHLTMLLATVLQHEDFEYDAENDTVEPKSSSEFLRKIEDHCKDIPDKEAKLSIVRNKVLEKMKRTVRRDRRLSTSGSVCSESSMPGSRAGSRAGSRTRQRSEDNEEELVPSKLSRGPHERKSRLPGPAQNLQ